MWWWAVLCCIVLHRTFVVPKTAVESVKALTDFMSYKLDMTERKVGVPNPRC